MREFVIIIFWVIFDKHKYSEYIYYTEVVGCEPKYAIELILKKQ